MADETEQAQTAQAAPEPDTEQAKEPADGREVEPKAKPEPKYTDADLDQIIGRKFAKWQAEQERKVAEAKKLAAMDAQQKADYEREQLEKKVADYERREQVREMTAEAKRQLAEGGVSVPDEVVTALVRDDAEQTKAAIDAFAEAFTSSVEAEVRRRLAGQAPKAGTAAKPVTKADVLAIPDTLERQKAIREHPELFREAK